MGFFKDFKDDLSQAVSELLPEKEGSNVDTSDQMVNTLDSDDLTTSVEAESQMKEWLEEFTQDEINELLQDENDVCFEVDNLTDDIQDDDIITDDNAIVDDNTIVDDLGIPDEIIQEEGSTEDGIIYEDGTKDDNAIVDDMGVMNDDISKDDDINDYNEEEISYEMMEDGVELMGKNAKFDENVDENMDVNFDELIEDDIVDEDVDDNIDLELLDTLNAEENEEAEDSMAKPEKKLRAASVADNDEVTVITKGTTIDGNISSDGSLDIMGNITGDVECLGKLSITGKIVGNSTAAEVYINTDRLEGSINSEGSVKVGLGTVIVGDIVATSGVIAGAVKGEIDINGPIVIDSTAIIKGNIKAKSVQINNGAVIEGFCSLSYSDIDVDNVFE